MEDLSLNWVIANGVVDLLFLIDIILNFNVAIYNDDYDIVHERAAVTWNYLSGWFIVDFTSIIPFELMFSNKGESSNLVRMSRIGRLYRIVKLLKLIRLLKLQK